MAELRLNAQKDLSPIEGRQFDWIRFKQVLRGDRRYVPTAYVMKMWVAAYDIQYVGLKGKRNFWTSMKRTGAFTLLALGGGYSAYHFSQNINNLMGLASVSGIMTSISCVASGLWTGYALASTVNAFKELKEAYRQGWELLPDSGSFKKILH